MVLDGAGIAQLPVWMVDEHIRSGKLAMVLEGYISKPLPFNLKIDMYR
ncbi:hypothetical protein [Photobacterium indicum]